MTTSSKPYFLSLLLCMALTLSGCATRALMSSDRYENPDPHPQQYHSTKVSPTASQLTLEQRYQKAYQVASHSAP